MSIRPTDQALDKKGTLMSEVKLNLVDDRRVLSGTIHGSIADACVAALSAEPETIAELEAALTRYIKRHDSNRFFALFHSTDCLSDFSALFAGPEPVSSHSVPLDPEPWDAGIVVIDVAARIVASESSYSQPGPDGEVFYHDGHALTDVPVLYRVPDDWLFVTSVAAYHWSRERHVRERKANPPPDARPILFGRPLLKFIVDAYLALPAGSRSALSSPAGVAAPADDGDEAMSEALAKEISDIHASWLETPREDLRGQAPRDVLLAHCEFIDFDLHTRSLQWSMQNEGPPCLGTESFAYRFAGFGTHECVLYYDLVRHLICRLVESKLDARFSTDPNAGCDSALVEQLIATLDQIKTDWLESPQPDCGGRIPAIVIDNERKRLPQALHPRDMIVDDDCPMCQMFGDETSPLGMGVGFWHLDGSHMDDDFAFSFFKTRQEWEVENRRREEFNREFNRRWKERQERIARGETLEHDPFFDPEPFDFEPSWTEELESADSPELELTLPLDAHPDGHDDADKTERD